MGQNLKTQKKIIKKIDSYKKHDPRHEQRGGVELGTRQIHLRPGFNQMAGAETYIHTTRNFFSTGRLHRGEYIRVLVLVRAFYW